MAYKRELIPFFVALSTIYSSDSASLSIAQSIIFFSNLQGILSICSLKQIIRYVFLLPLNLLISQITIYFYIINTSFSKFLVFFYGFNFFNFGLGSILTHRIYLIKCRSIFRFFLIELIQAILYFPVSEFHIVMYSNNQQRIDIFLILINKIKNKKMKMLQQNPKFKQDIIFSLHLHIFQKSQQNLEPQHIHPIHHNKNAKIILLPSCWTLKQQNRKLFYIIYSISMTLELKKKKKENDYLEEASIINHTLKDEIQKQIKINSIVQHEYQAKIIALQSTATSLCRAIETQKKKNIDLKTIIIHLQNKLYEQKKMQQCTTDSNTENMENLNKKIKKLEYDIDQIIQKHNESHAQINEIKERVNACRTERVIYSSVFKNIQKEIKSSEQQFKKLLIERIEVEKTKEATELQYIKNQEEAEKKNIQATKLQKSYKDVLETKLSDEVDKANFLKDAPKIQQRKFIELNKAESSIHSHLNKKLNLNKKGEELTGYEIMFNKLKSDTGIEDHKQLIHLLNNINQVNENLYYETDELLKKIDSYEDKLKEINKKKRKKISYFEQKKYGSYSHLSKIKDTIEKLDEKIVMEKEMIYKLKDSNNLKQLLELLNVKNPEDSPRQQDIFGLYQKIEEKIHQIILNSKKNNPSAFELTSNQQNLNQQQNILTELLEYTQKTKLVDKIMLPGELQDECKRSIVDIKQNRKLYQKTVVKKKK